MGDSFEPTPIVSFSGLSPLPLKCSKSGHLEQPRGLIPDPTDDSDVRATRLRKRGAGHLTPSPHDEGIWHATETFSKREGDRYFGYHMYLKTYELSNITSLSSLLDSNHPCFLQRLVFPHLLYLLRRLVENTRKRGVVTLYQQIFH